jgi:hypothetical protein
MHLKPGGLRELHWYAIATEWDTSFKARKVLSQNFALPGSALANFPTGDGSSLSRVHRDTLDALDP